MSELSELLETVFINNPSLANIPNSQQNKIHEMQSGAENCILELQDYAAKRSLTLGRWTQVKTSFQHKIFVMQMQVENGQVILDLPSKIKIRSIFDSVNPDGTYAQSSQLIFEKSHHRVVYDIYDLEYPSVKKSL